MIPASDIDVLLRHFGVYDDERKREFEAQYIQPFADVWGSLGRMKFPLVDQAIRYGAVSARQWLEALIDEPVTPQ